MFAGDKPWWEKGLNFECTQCGKCCRVTGDVWLTDDEANATASLLDLSLSAFLAEYVSGEPVDGWVRLRDRDNAAGGQSCCFLADDGKTCTIYEVRPEQCRTYPWWPRLLRSREAWEAEAVVPDGQPGRQWTADGGGCEGIFEVAPLVSADVIRLNAEMHAARARRFPTDAL
ncbi:unnamed protein product, partial [Phaeothamnion confervicola]